MLSGSFELLDSRGPPMSPSLTAGATAPKEVLLFCIFSHVFSFGGHEIQSKALSHGAQAPQCRWVGGIKVAVKEHERYCFSSDQESQGLPVKLSTHVKCTYVLEVINFNRFFSSASHFKGLQVVPSIYFH